MSFQAKAKEYINPELMAEDYLAYYYGNEPIEYPIDPFMMLKNEGVFFSLVDFKWLEGVYIPASPGDNKPIVGINGNRPITRQRFTAAHELCHHLRDFDRKISCPFTSKNPIELFANKFASAILMPIDELRIQVDKYKDSKGNVSFLDVLKIADYFGVSFESCLFRIAYRLNAIEGDTESYALKERIKFFHPDKQRKDRHMTYQHLYAGLIDDYSDQLAFIPSDFSRNVFQNNYIYNDSRMEGLNVSQEQAAEIVTDLRMNAQHSIYCKNDKDEAFQSISGHYDMYQEIFKIPVPDHLSIYDMFGLNKLLFKYYPYPEFGGTVRGTNTLVMGAKFESVDYQTIYPELSALDETVKYYYEHRFSMPLSEYIKHIAEVHYRITVIHPFADGNGRTSRAFMNIQLVRSSLPPIYINVEEKSDYIRALKLIDKTGNYDELYEIIFKSILKSHIELRSSIL